MIEQLIGAVVALVVIGFVAKKLYTKYKSKQ